ncbi:telomerase Cajal body protein 1-like isoform X2 [Mya arenaria]|uniref:telomerase Cajal body protein 1-like isoform X2 n=1 Tax=Mya arenaria TaxID=6604 RepID=UPI0022E8293E|nr:telomerase Cajal body protein 1-like isoform X2 [Mya arenaria]
MEQVINNEPVLIDAVASPTTSDIQPENNDPNSLPPNTDTGIILQNFVQENGQQIDVQSSNSGCLSLSYLCDNVNIVEEPKQNDSSGSLEVISESPDNINSVKEQQQKDTAGSLEVISVSPNIISDTPPNDDALKLNTSPNIISDTPPNDDAFKLNTAPNIISDTPLNDDALKLNTSPNIISDTPPNDDALKLNIGQNLNNKNTELSDHDIFSSANDGQCKINDSPSVIGSSKTDVVVNSFLPCNTTPTFSADLIASKISVDQKCESRGGSCQDKSSEMGPTEGRPFKRQKTEDISECSSVMETESKELALEEERIESVNTSNTQEEKVASVYQFRNEPRQITGAWKCFKNDNINNYMRGCKWAPDGTCLLVNSNDNKLRMFNLPEELYYEGGERKVIPELVPVFGIKEADTVYDFSWFPLMSSTDPAKACFAVTSKDTPIHLYDAFTGQLRCTYRAYNHVDEVVAAHCVEFSCDGNKIYAGFNKIIRVFDVTRPGREFKSRPTFAKEGQRGIISCIAPSPTDIGLYAAGSYAKSVALYNEPMGEMVCIESDCVIFLQWLCTMSLWGRWCVLNQIV